MGISDDTRKFLTKLTYELFAMAVLTVIFNMGGTDAFA